MVLSMLMLMIGAPCDGSVFPSRCCPQRLPTIKVATHRYKVILAIVSSFYSNQQTQSQFYSPIFLSETIPGCPDHWKLFGVLSLAFCPASRNPRARVDKCAIYK